MSVQCELNDLKRSMLQIQKTLAMLEGPAVDMTRLVFHSKRRSTVRNMYVMSHLLNKYEYFQACHSQDYSETQDAQGTSTPSNKLSEDIAGDVCDEDSDDEWEIDEQHPAEPNSTSKFKATIHIKETSQRTYKAFIDYALCGAPYFAPLRSSYKSYDAFDLMRKDGYLSWPQWAEANCTHHSTVPGIKTLTSAKSMYRMADMLIIPELKKICQDQIIKSLAVNNVFHEMNSQLFQQHQ